MGFVFKVLWGYYHILSWIVFVVYFVMPCLTLFDKKKNWNENMSRVYFIIHFNNNQQIIYLFVGFMRRVPKKINLHLRNTGC